MKHKHIKRWGQVFLKNPAINRKIGNYLNSQNFKNLLEIGPGTGVLTEQINVDGKNLVLVEIDKKLSAYLREKFPNLEVINDDFLNIDLDNIFSKSEKSFIFGNIPYYITTPIIFSFLKSVAFSEAVFMVQKQYYESMNSEVNDKKYSSFSVILKNLTKIKKIFNVERYNFFPIPKVDSVVIHLVKQDSKLWKNFDLFAKFLKNSFFMPRKTINNNWKRFLSHEQINEILSENNISPLKRPDELSPETYKNIFLSKSGQRIFKDIF